MISSFEDLDVWRKSHHFTLSIYKLTSSFPQEEKYGLISQIRRAAVSVENNIAEGTGRRTTKDLINFLYNSLGSAQELRCLLRICYDLGYIRNADYSSLKILNMDVVKMLKRLIGSLSVKSPIL